uniref:Uncharacterized protein n=1 Tax=Arundo donax TaxID=35708 RepID=A0A0A9AZW4_ARUDO
MMQGGAFTVNVMVAILRIYNYLDEYMYSERNTRDEHHKRWRHFMSASFFADVLRGKDYL